MEVGWTELMVIGIVALVVIGPKDLPEMFRTLGRFTAKLRSMARDFSRAMEDAARETGVKDVADDLRKVASPKSMGLDAVKSAADKFEKWDPLKGTKPVSTPKPVTPAGLSPTPAAVTPAPGATSTPAPAATTTPAPGPATAALAEKVAERKAAAAETVEKLRAAAAPALAEEAVKRPGRTRSSAPKATEPKAAKPAPKAAAEAAPKPKKPAAARKTPAKAPE